MTDHPTTAARDLYEAILREPAEDLPRLIYAEEIEPYDPERAEFIRLQIAGEYAEPLPKWVETMMMEIGVSTESKDGESFEYFGTAACYRNDKTVMEYVWRRGFPHAVAMTMQAFVGGECERCDGLAERGETLRRSGRRILCRKGCCFECESCSAKPGTPTLCWPCLELRRMCAATDSNVCPDCHGTGTIPSLASVICERWPVTEIRIVDREPMNGVGIFEPNGLPKNACVWFGNFSDVADDKSEIPTAIFEKVTSEGHHREDNRNQSWHRNRESAQLALSHAAVAYARELAGLPPLKYACSTQTVAV